MTAIKRLRPEIEQALPLGNASLRSSAPAGAPLVSSPRWETLMELARITARDRGERVRVVGGWSGRGTGTHAWVYVIECGSWCGCRRAGQ